MYNKAGVLKGTIMTGKGILYIVAIPIGNWGDITQRAVETIRECDALVCEEFKPGSTLLKKLGIESKEIVQLNEHNEAEVAANLLTRLLQGQSLALVSDCGTPVFSDPGSYLIQLAASSGVKVTPIPGASSLMAALSVLDFHLERFIFGGFLPRDPEARKRELGRLPTAAHAPGADGYTLPPGFAAGRCDQGFPRAYEFPTIRMNSPLRGPICLRTSPALPR